jgi:hypothetical protein
LPFLPGCLGGLIGGLGLVLCVGTCYRRLLSPRYLLRGAAIGTLAALPFALWAWLFMRQDYGSRNVAPFAFAIWQAAMGRYLYAICTDADKKAQGAE